MGNINSRKIGARLIATARGAPRVDMRLLNYIKRSFLYAHFTRMPDPTTTIKKTRNDQPHRNMSSLVIISRKRWKRGVGRCRMGRLQGISESWTSNFCACLAQKYLNPFFLRYTTIDSLETYQSRNASLLSIIVAYPLN
jgi:hypothetical protein